MGVTGGRPVMFRAGGQQGERGPVPMTARAVPAFTGPHVLMADCSEFQPQIADARYLLWSQAIVIRAMYGSSHDDLAWYGGQRRDLLHAGGAQFLGIYQYVTASEDAAVQARALARLVRAMRPGEKIIADIEEGAGNQARRWQAWAGVIRDKLGDDPWNYSGLFFARSAGIEPVDWLAAYQGAEPGVPHKLWQFTDAYSVPGVGTCDASVFHGTIGELRALTYGEQPARDWTEEAIMALPTLREGARDQPGQMRHVARIQRLTSGIGAWNSLGPVTQVKDDGVFGPTTTAAVKAVQKFFGLAQDGICGPDTWTKLIGAR